MGAEAMSEVEGQHLSETDVLVVDAIVSAVLRREEEGADAIWVG